MNEIYYISKNRTHDILTWILAWLIVLFVLSRQSSRVRVRVVFGYGRCSDWFQGGFQKKEKLFSLKILLILSFKNVQTSNVADKNFKNSKITKCSFSNQNWVSESRVWRCCLLYSARRDQFSRLLIFWRFFLILSIWCNRWRKKSLEFVLGMFWNVGCQNVSRTLLWCSGRLQEIVKAPETIVILIIILHFNWIEVVWYVVTRRGVTRSMISAI